MSQRDGWAHLYLYDRVTGRVKNQITKGNWQVNFVDRIDAATRQIYFHGNGMDAGKDPYFMHFFRVNFDGTGLTRFTTGDGTHTLSPNPRDWNANTQYYVDTYSRVDMPPVSELRRVSDPTVGDAAGEGQRRRAAGHGLDLSGSLHVEGPRNQTDIWGIIIRPTNFDPSKKYPVIENIYAGPQGSFVPEAWSTQGGMQGLAELGFIVVQIDGLGTANRSQGVPRLACKNIGDAGFPDRIIWHKASPRSTRHTTSRASGSTARQPADRTPPAACCSTRSSTRWRCPTPGVTTTAWTRSGGTSSGWAGRSVHSTRRPQTWSTRRTSRAGCKLVVPELDTNVDPASTMQVVNALVRAGKEFELVVIPGADHGAGSPITARKRNDFFVKYLRGIEPPNWNDVPVNAAAGNGDDLLLQQWIDSENWGMFPYAEER
jgi:hypothetical protein